MKLHLQLTLDRLGPEYQKGQTYFSMVVSAGLEPAAGETVTADRVRELLQPWTWESYPAITVATAPEDLSAWRRVTGTIVTELPPADIGNLAALHTAELEAQLKAFEPLDYTWLPAPGGEQTIEHHAITGRAHRNWRAYLAHAGTTPGGLALHLRLQLFFFVATSDVENRVVVAAPSIKVTSASAEIAPDDPATSGVITAVKVPEQKTLPNALLRWTYKSSSLEVDAYVNRPKPLFGVKDGGFINIQTLWREQRALTVGNDWLAQLPEVIAPVFDLPPRLLDVLRTHGTGPVPAGFVEAFKLALFETVRPALDTTRVPPDGGGVIFRVLFSEAANGDFKFPTSLPAAWPPELGDVLRELDLNNARESLDRLVRFWTAFAASRAFINTVLELWGSSYLKSADEWKVVLSKVAPKLEREAIHPWFVLHNLGSSWPRLFPTNETAGGTELKELAARLPKIANEFADTALGKAFPGLADAIAARVKEVVQKAADQLSADPTADGLNVQIDKVDSDTSPKVQTDHDDFLRQLSGVGVLLRQDRADAEWRCLNMATVRVRNTQPNPDVEFLPVAGGPLAVPRRFQYANRMRQSFVNYVNQPLISVSPWIGLTEGRKKEEIPDAHKTEVGFRYDSPYGKALGWKLERLVYGEKYQVGVFYFGTAGNLPAEAAEGTGTANAKPWKFALPAPAAKFTTVGLTYLRRCAIGGLRLNAGRGVQFPPPIPERVYPLARAMQGLPGTTEKGAAHTALDPKGGSQDPLVMLRPTTADAAWNTSLSSTSARVLIRPPALDIKVWDRWQAETESNRARRREVLEAHFTLLDDQSRGDRREVDPSLDDPAVTAFTVRFARVFPAPETIFDVPTVFDFGTVDPKELALQQEQKPGRAVVFASAAQVKPTATLEAGEVIVRIPDGQAWRVEFVPVVPEDARFDRNVVKDLNVPTIVVVEVMSLLFSKPAEQQNLSVELHKALSAARDTTVVGDPQWRVLIDPSKLASVATLVHRSETLVQRWRWNGRPVFEDPTNPDPAKSSVCGLPFAEFRDNALPESFAGDGMLFGDRDDDDHLESVAHVDFAKFPAETGPQSIYVLQGTAAAGVIYHRFGVRVYSRYEGFLRSDHRLDSTAAAKNQGRRWHRHVVPLRFDERVPKPLVKLVVPLTETLEGAPGQMPGWLVWLDESWYNDRTGGLGEYLESEIVQVRLPDNPDEHRYQFGPDPIIDMSEDPYGDVDLPLPPRPVGATGFTFDTDSSAPLFTGCCFHQAPPNVPGHEDLSFHFLQIRFARAIVGRDPKNPRAEPSRSAFTDPYWVQVLPPANRWRAKTGSADPAWIAAADIALGSGGTLVGRSKPKDALTVLPTAAKPGHSHFELFGLVTRAIADAFGRGNQEVLHSLVPLAAMQVPGSILAEARVRIVEVQFRRADGDPPLPTTLAGLAGMLFPNSEDWDQVWPAVKDASARIVRMSPPIRL